MDQSATIAITRQKSYFACARRFRVLCDGVEVARVSNDSTETFEITPGPHSIQVKFDWLVGKPLDVTLLPGRTLHLMCGRADDFLQSALATFLLPNTYLTPSVVSAEQYASHLNRPGPAWGKAVALGLLWTLILAVGSLALLQFLGDSQALSPRHSQRMGQITGLLLVAGWGVILIRTYSKRS